MGFLAGLGGAAAGGGIASSAATGAAIGAVANKNKTGGEGPDIGSHQPIDNKSFESQVEVPVPDYKEILKYISPTEKVSGI
jgi:hypothetical protein